MTSELVDLTVDIVRFEDDCQPGIVACELVEADGRCHTLIDKAPMFTTELLGAHSTYPKPGRVRCTASRHWRDDRGRDLVAVSTENPDSIASLEGLSDFVVLRSQILAGLEDLNS